MGLAEAGRRGTRRRTRELMSLLSRLFHRSKSKSPQASDIQNAIWDYLNDPNRKTPWGWNTADAKKLEAIWTSNRFPKPSVTITEKGEVFVCPELARELEKPGNEGVTELLLDMGWTYPTEPR